MPARVGIDLVFTPFPAVVARAFFMSAERMRQLQEPMERVAQIISREIQENFDAQGRPSGWEELKESTVAKKASAGLDPRILRATGALLDGLTMQGQHGLGSWDISQDGNEWVGVLQDPTGYGWRHLDEFPHRFMPSRDWSFVPDETQDEIEDAFRDWLEWVFEPVEAV